MKRCVIFGAGVYDKRQPLIYNTDYIIAADGGYDKCKELGFTPDITIGDFDSAVNNPSGNTVRLPVEKDVTDLDAAVSLALNENCNEIHIYGGMGGRPDHTLANYSLIARLSIKGIKAYLYGDGYTVTALHNGHITLTGRKGSTVSVFSWTEISEGVTLEGLKYPLTAGTLTNTFSLGVSNSFEKSAASVSVEKGVLLIMQESDF